MTHTYNISGFTCANCVAIAKTALLKLEDVISAEVQLNTPQATIAMSTHIDLSVLQESLAKAGNYKITLSPEEHQDPAVAPRFSWFSTYKPILLTGGYITGITLLLHTSVNGFDWNNWMTDFMAAFFLFFSFFKLLDLKGFADSYATYDIIARRWRKWGFAYPFIELALGIAFMLRLSPMLVNGVAFVVMSISIIGVMQSVLLKKRIRCACLGTVFNLPMSTITIIEDSLMIGMSGYMMLSMI